MSDINYSLGWMDIAHRQNAERDAKLAASLLEIERLRAEVTKRREEWCGGCECDIEKLRQQLATCRAILRKIYAKAVRNKHNLNWHEITLKDDEMAAILKAAGEK